MHAGNDSGNFERIFPRVFVVYLSGRRGTVARNVCGRARSAEVCRRNGQRNGDRAAARCGCVRSQINGQIGFALTRLVLHQRTIRHDRINLVDAENPANQRAFRELQVRDAIMVGRDVRHVMSQKAFVATIGFLKMLRRKQHSIVPLDGERDVGHSHCWFSPSNRPATFDARVCLGNMVEAFLIRPVRRGG